MWLTIKRTDHVSVVIDDLAAAIAFFTALGMTVQGEAPVEGLWVDRVNGLENVQVNIVMMRSPDGHGPSLSLQRQWAGLPRLGGPKIAFFSGSALWHCSRRQSDGRRYGVDEPVIARVPLNDPLIRRGS